MRCASVSGHLHLSPSCGFLKHGPDHHPSLRFLHNYAAYLEERIWWLINQARKLQPAVAQGDFGSRCYDEKSVDMVFRKLPKCQVFMDRVLDCSPFDVLPSDNLGQAAMGNTLKESFQVYKKYCEGMAVLVNMFFDLTAPARALAWGILKKASRQSLELSEFYHNCKQIIGNKNLEYPTVQIITMDHVLALEKCSTSFPTCNNSPLPTKNRSIRLQAVPGVEPRSGRDTTDSIMSSLTLPSSALETKISKVWVVFEDQDQEQAMR